MRTPNNHAMTRINCIPPSELSTGSLPRIFGLVIAAIDRGESPDDARNPPAYGLGPGHVRFFYPRLAWCAARYGAVVSECRIAERLSKKGN